MNFEELQKLKNLDSVSKNDKEHWMPEKRPKYVIGVCNPIMPIDDKDPLDRDEWGAW